MAGVHAVERIVRMNVQRVTIETDPIASDGALLVALKLAQGDPTIRAGQIARAVQQVLESVLRQVHRFGARDGEALLFPGRLQPILDQLQRNLRSAKRTRSSGAGARAWHPSAAAAAAASSTRPIVCTPPPAGRKLTPF